MSGFTDEATPHQITVEAFGVALQIRASTAALLAEIEPYLPPPGDAPPASHPAHRMGIVAQDDGHLTVYDGERAINSGPGLHTALVVLDSRMRMHVAIHAPGKVFVHAGAVAHGGGAIVIPGNSFSGKSTLVAALVRAGATYYSDEYAVFDEEGLVHPYPKRLSLRRPEDQLQVEHRVDELGGVAGQQPAPLRLALLTTFVAAATWRPRRLSAAQGALALLAHAVPARLRPDETLRSLTRALGHATVLEGDRGEATELAGQVLATVEG